MMWISEKLKGTADTPAACAGEVTIGGENAAVATFGEMRGVAVYAPGGYVWRPAVGDKVLVLKSGTGGEEKYIIAAKNEKAPVSVAPGEVCIYSNGATIKIGSGGRIDITGNLYINGEEYKRCTCTEGVT